MKKFLEYSNKLDKFSKFLCIVSGVCHRLFLNKMSKFVSGKNEK